MRVWASRGFGPVCLGVSFGLKPLRAARRLTRSDRTGYVYIVRREGDDFRLKIGSSIDPPQRLRSLQTGSADRLYVAWSTPVRGDHEAVEHEAHAILDRHRGLGEWFSVPTDVAVAAISAASFRVGQQEDVERYPRRTRLIQNVVMCSLPVIAVISLIMHVSAAETPTDQSPALPLRGGAPGQRPLGHGQPYCTSQEQIKELELALSRNDEAWVRQLKSCWEMAPGVKLEEIETLQSGKDYHIAKVRAFLHPTSELGYAIIFDAH